MTCDQGIKLEPFSPLHISKTFEWVSDAELRRQFMMRGEVTWEGHLAHFERVLADSRQRVYAITAGGLHMGNCGFKNLIPEKREGELWTYLGDPATRGKGIGLRATQLLVEEGFRGLGLDLIYLHVADFNAAARNIYRKLGFIEVPLQGDAGDWAGRGCEIVRMELRKA